MILLLKLCFSVSERLELVGSSGEVKDSCEYKSAVAVLINYYEYRTTYGTTKFLFAHSELRLSLLKLLILFELGLVRHVICIFSELLTGFDESGIVYWGLVYRSG